MTSVTVLRGDCRAVLRELPAASVHTVITSPPYFGLRDYGHDGQLGLEATPDEFVAALVGVFREVRRVLRDDGTVWLNLGDSYAGGGSGPPGERSTLMGNGHQGGGPKRKALAETRPRPGRIAESAAIPQKNLIGIPWMVAFALRADGWYLRSEIIWAKPNPMPESATDRPTRSHEQVFLLSKGPRYFYDAHAIREEQAAGTAARVAAGFRDRYADGAVDARGYRGPVGGQDGIKFNPAGRNKRSVWTVATQPYADAHFATFPPKLIEPCVLAGCPERACVACGAPWERVTEGGSSTWEARKAAGATWGNIANAASGGGTQRVVHGKGVSRDLTPAPAKQMGFVPGCGCGVGHAPGVVLDPFSGAGTTGVVALGHGRSYVGVELNPEYAAMSRRRMLGVDLPIPGMSA